MRDAVAAVTIARVLDDEALRATLVERGRAQAATRSRAAAAETVLAVYEEFA